MAKARLEKSASVSEVFPYSLCLPDLTAEQAAEAAVKALRTPYLCDALALLWQMRLVSKKEQAEPINPATTEGKTA